MTRNIDRIRMYTVALTLALCMVSHATVRNVILVVGDGMGVPQIGLLLQYARYASNSLMSARTTAFEAMAAAGEQALVLVEPANGLVVDSSSSATQMGSGRPSWPQMLGVDADGKPAESVLAKARARGKATGLVSDTRITHATPASFVAHVPHRGAENDIARALAQTGADVMFSGGLPYFLPASVSNSASAAYAEAQRRVGTALPLASTRHDDCDVLDEAASNGYTVIFTRDQMLRAQHGKILGLFGTWNMPDGIEEWRMKADPNRTMPTLREMSMRAIELLDSNPTGFFLMVEAGQIDWASHQNDAGLLLYEMLRYDETLRAICAWAEGRTDTVVITTADHETGGFAFSPTGYNAPAERPFPGEIVTNTTYTGGGATTPFSTLDKLAQQRKSFGAMLGEFYGLPIETQTLAAMCAIVNSNCAFQITHNDDSGLLASVLELQGAPAAKLKKLVPRVDDWSKLAVHDDAYRVMGLLRQIVARKQHTFWAGGSHVHTPVPLAVIGPREAIARFRGVRHMTDVGNAMIALCAGE